MARSSSNIYAHSNELSYICPPLVMRRSVRENRVRALGVDCDWMQVNRWKAAFTRIELICMYFMYICVYIYNCTYICFFIYICAVFTRDQQRSKFAFFQRCVMANRPMNKHISGKRTSWIIWSRCHRTYEETGRRSCGIIRVDDFVLNIAVQSASWIEITSSRLFFWSRKPFRLAASPSNKHSVDMHFVATTGLAEIPQLTWCFLTGSSAFCCMLWDCCHDTDEFSRLRKYL